MNILKQHIVQKYPFTRLREQDKLSFMEILCVHYDVQSKSQKSVHLQKYQSKKSVLTYLSDENLYSMKIFSKEVYILAQRWIRFFAIYWSRDYKS